MRTDLWTKYFFDSLFIEYRLSFECWLRFCMKTFFRFFFVSEKDYMTFDFVLKMFCFLLFVTKLKPFSDKKLANELRTDRHNPIICIKY